MQGIINFETFLLTGILLNLTPGNDTLFILSRSIAQGKKAGIMSVLGIGTGSLVHSLLAAFGLSVVIGRSILLFNIVKYTGAAYLIFMGIKMVIDRTGLNFDKAEISKQTNFKKIYRDAVLTNVLNPKVAMFFIAFLPQFIDPVYKNTTVPFLTLALLLPLLVPSGALYLPSFLQKFFGGCGTINYFLPGSIKPAASF